MSSAYIQINNTIHLYRQVTRFTWPQNPYHFYQVRAICICGWSRRNLCASAVRQWISGLTLHCVAGRGTAKNEGKGEKCAVSTELSNNRHSKTKHGFCWGNISGTFNFTVRRHSLASTFSGLDRHKPFLVVECQVESTSISHLPRCTQDLKLHIRKLTGRIKGALLRRGKMKLSQRLRECFPTRVPQKVVGGSGRHCRINTYEFWNAVENSQHPSKHRGDL
jgi:hypothetical protein